jgi:HK97 gp10 family phage protein
VASKGFISFTVKGGKELDRTLNKMDRRLASKALKGGMKAAMEPVKDEAKRRVPVDTGLLRRSIRIATYGGKGYVGAVVRSGTRKQLKIPQDAKHYYPAYIEYGSQGKLARPFLRSAFAAKKNMVLNRVADDIRKAIERVK